MKLGISYNLFDSHELMPGSIKCIRNQVDYISVVYQNVSNYGNINDINLDCFLESLLQSKLIDEYILYDPDFNISPHHNELNKRNLGLSLSLKESCTHHMSIDADEYYIGHQFRWLKGQVDTFDYDSSFCMMQTYYKTSEYVLYPPEDYYVSLIYKIKPYSFYELSHKTPVLVDPTRRMNNRSNAIICDRKQIQMHHMSHIRADYRKKIINSSARCNYEHMINDIVKSYDQWSFESNIKPLINGIPHNIKRTKNIFNVKL